MPYGSLHFAGVASGRRSESRWPGRLDRTVRRQVTGGTHGPFVLARRGIGPYQPPRQAGTLTA